jgi:hypothetical protein
VPRNSQSLQRKAIAEQQADRPEREAEQVADAVMGARAESIGDRLRGAALGAGVHRHGTFEPPPPAVSGVIGSSGRPIEPVARGLMEARFGFSFDRVRIHDDANAARSASAIGARAYTVGEHVVFGSGQYAPASDAGRRLLAHELAHVAQQSVAGVRGLQLQPLAAPAATAAGPDAIADRVIALLTVKDEIAGVGDLGGAFAILTGLGSEQLVQVLERIDARAMLGVLRGGLGYAGNDRARQEAFTLAVLYRHDRLLDAECDAAHGIVGSLSASDQALVASALAQLPEHRRQLFLNGPQAEATRLQDTQVAFWEEKRKAAEQTAKHPVTTGDVVQKDVESGALKPAPTAAWTGLPEPVKDKWKNERAPAAFSKVLASIKGTELEGVMKGHNLVFDPEAILHRGAYAYQAGNDLVCGMTFVQDAEADPKNVWPILAHEIGGHFAYGTSYADSFIYRARDRLPESDRKQWTDTPEGRGAFFDAYAYNETEIFAALRQRRYDVPVTGQAPTHGALRPDANIEGRLSQMDRAFPKAVAEAILDELDRKVQRDTTILDRDKQHFLEQVKEHGYSL